MPGTTPRKFPKRPRTRASARRSSRSRITVLALIVLIIVIIGFIGPIILGFSTDWLWFGEVGFRRVFSTVLITRIVVFLLTGIITGVITWFAGYMAYKRRPEIPTAHVSDSPLHEYRRVIEKSLKKIFIIIPVLFGIMVGIVAQSNWQTVLLFLHRQSFGHTDAQFGHDLGFYAFIVPMLRLSVSLLSLSLVIAFFISLITHYLFGGIRAGNTVTGVKARIFPAARVHLAVIAGLWFMLRVGKYALDRYALLSNEHDNFVGGSYTDIKAHLPALLIMMIVAFLVALAFFSAIFLRDIRIPALATALMILTTIVVGAAWPLVVEQFSVKPNRAEKEREYIGRNIEATRYAYGLTDDQVTYEYDWGANSATDDAVAEDKATLSNIRLLDPEVLSDTFTQQQQLRNFYGFPETLAIDRYTIDGELRDFVVAARELNPDELSENQRDWINRHTVYTHGNGFIAAPANQVDEVAQDVGSTRGGYPVYYVSDLSTLENSSSEEAEKLGISVDQPRLYYGPVIAGSDPSLDYAIVGSSGTPVEYDTDSERFSYDGAGGVSIGNIFSRALYAAKYREINLVLSDRINESSKIIYTRDPRERVAEIAPWLTTDSKTYPAVIDGKIKWIVDGYTTLSSLPYSTTVSLSSAIVDSQTEADDELAMDKIGYIRNSVKAVVDAYDGTVDLYEFDETDPVLKAWEGAFPGTVKPKSEISDALMEHLRYPEDLFKVQRQLMARYHVDDPGAFFTNDSFWSVPGDPTKNEKEQKSQPPYYVVAADPETQEPSFQLITPFRGLRREFLAAHMTVSSDPETYGKITVRVLPTSTQTLGPKQAQDAMVSSDQVARDLTLWKGTNEVIYGNLLTLPVGGGEIMYVEPIYTKRTSQDSAFPKLLRVLVLYKGKIGYAATIAEALTQVGVDPREAVDLQKAQESGATTSVTTDTSATSASSDSSGTTEQSTDASTTATTSVLSDEEAITKINDALRDVESARDGSFESYGRALDALDAAIKAYQEQQATATSTAATASATATP